MSRLFIAINLSNDVNSAIAAALAAEHARPGVAWVRPENYHVTLKFLGSADPAQVPAITSAMSEVVHHLPAELRAHGLGAFPSPKRARVLWVGLDDPAVKLRTLADELEYKLETLGFVREARPFHPHLTVGRLRAPRDVGGLLEKYGARDFGISRVSEIVLYESQTLPTGPRYTPQSMIRARGL